MSNKISLFKGVQEMQKAADMADISVLSVLIFEPCTDRNRNGEHCFEFQHCGHSTDLVVEYN